MTQFSRRNAVQIVTQLVKTRSTGWPKLTSQLFPDEEVRAHD